MTPGEFSHLGEQGDARMVDVGKKPACRRVAVACGELVCSPETLRLLEAKALPKGDVLAVARVAGILAAKRADELVPLCHTLPLESVSVDFTPRDDRIEIRAAASTSAKTGVEIEALAAVSVAALALYDMMKSADKTMRVENIRVTEKRKE